MVEKISWSIVNQLGKTYLDVQKTRVAMDLRCQQAELKELIYNGLATEMYTYSDVDEKDEESLELTPEKRRIRIRKVEVLKGKNKTEQKEIDEKKKEILTTFRENNDSFKLLLSHKLRLHKQEQDLLDETVKLIAHMNLWKWCQTVRGMGEVAAMTFVSYVTPIKGRNVGQVWRYIGLTPGQRLKKGEQASFNKRIKARFLGVLVKNVIMADDPYYAEMYRIKREYYRNRPDLLNKWTDGKGGQRSGFKGHTEKMAKRALCKLLISHAYELLSIDRNIPVDNKWNTQHRNSLPIKPSTIKSQQELLERYAKIHAAFLEKLKKVWAEGDLEKYQEVLTHFDIDSINLGKKYKKEKIIKPIKVKATTRGVSRKK